MMFPLVIVPETQTCSFSCNFQGSVSNDSKRLYGKEEQLQKQRIIISQEPIGNGRNAVSRASRNIFTLTSYEVVPLH